jgi:hypothetical protein
VPIEGTHPPPADPEGNAHSDDSEVVVGGGPTIDTIRGPSALSVLPRLTRNADSDHLDLQCLVCSSEVPPVLAGLVKEARGRSLGTFAYRCDGRNDVEERIGQM